MYNFSYLKLTILLCSKKIKVTVVCLKYQEINLNFWLEGWHFVAKEKIMKKIVWKNQETMSSFIQFIIISNLTYKYFSSS